ncbi:MAG: hypothetical protein ACFFB0_02135 [Promethearchaeota archaeon]
MQVRDAHISVFGEERWNNFFQRFNKHYTTFPNDPLSSTRIPIDIYLSFIDELTQEFYNGNQRIYWGFGEQGAQTALSEDGHLNIFVRVKRSPENFIKYVLARIWTNYFDMGREEFKLEGNILHARILDLPKYHPYFELTTMGYIKKALELIGLTVEKTTKIKSSAKEIYYQFILNL